MAYQVGSACFESATAAVQALAASHVPVASPDVLISVGATSETAITFVYTPVATGQAPYSVAMPVVLQPCNMLTTDDAMSLTWTIGGVWIAVYCIIFIARALRGETGGEYGSHA